jgi:hypothetical protein
MINKTVDYSSFEDDEAFWRELTIPEEDRHLFTSMPWKPGEWRWFRSPNVVCLETWRRKKQPPA